MVYPCSDEHEVYSNSVEPGVTGESGGGDGKIARGT